MMKPYLVLKCRPINNSDYDDGDGDTNTNFVSTSTFDEGGEICLYIIELNLLNSI